MMKPHILKDTVRLLVHEVCVRKKEIKTGKRLEAPCLVTVKYRGILSQN